MKIDLLRVFPSIRRWDSYPEEVKAVTSPPDFEMGKLEEKLFDLVVRIDHRVNHIRQDIAYFLPWSGPWDSLHDWVMPEHPCDCDH